MLNKPLSKTHRVNLRPVPRLAESTESAPGEDVLAGAPAHASTRILSQALLPAMKLAASTYAVPRQVPRDARSVRVRPEYAQAGTLAPRTAPDEAPARASLQTSLAPLALHFRLCDVELQR